MKYYLIFCDTYINGIILNELELKQLKKIDTSYKTIVEIDAAMVSTLKEVLF